ncbi:MAG TPA: Rv3235 family protein [Sporichthya sp.]|nr:Rv3235 family protein [Sporichthya sp.]
MSVAAAARNQQKPGPHCVPVPATEPPYDDVVVPLPVRPAPDATLPLPFPHPDRPRDVPRPQLRLVPDPPAPAGAVAAPTLRNWAETAAMAIAQILTGERPPGRFRQAVVPEVYALLSRRAALAPTGPRQRAVLRAVHVCCPARGVAEVVTVVHGLARPKALAFRLEARRTRWICTALELG